MNITEYRHSADFFSDNQAVIVSNILEAELVYLNARGNTGTDRGFYGAAVKDGQNTLLAVQTPPYPMVFFIAGIVWQPLAAQMAKHLIKTDKVPAVVSGNLASTREIIDAFLKQGVAYRAGRHLLQRKCEKLIDIQTLDLPLVSASELSYDFTEDTRSFLKECRAKYDPNRLQQDVFAMRKSNDFFGLINRGAVVSMGRLQHMLPNARAVGVIYTPPKYRGLGYATSCVKQLTRRIFQDGYDFAYLYAERDNPVSNHIYEKLGYVKTDDFIEYHRMP